MSYLNGTPVEEKLTAINDAIRSKTGKTGKLDLDQMAESIPEVYDKGFEAGKGAYWDDLQQNGKRKDYDYMFSGYYWTPDTFDPKHIPVKPERAAGMFANAAKLTVDLSEEKYKKIIDLSECTAFSSTFAESGITGVGIINATLNPNNRISYGFQSAKNLKKIEKFITSEVVTYSQTFSYCNSLEDITVEGVIGADISFLHSPLNAKSLVSVVEHLSDTASGKTATFKQFAIDNAIFPVTSEKTSITYASWDELKATKQNWSFAYA